MVYIFFSLFKPAIIMQMTLGFKQSMQYIENIRRTMEADLKKIAELEKKIEDCRQEVEKEKETAKGYVGYKAKNREAEEKNEVLIEERFKLEKKIKELEEEKSQLVIKSAQMDEEKSIYVKKLKEEITSLKKLVRDERAEASATRTAGRAQEEKIDEYAEKYKALQTTLQAVNKEMSALKEESEEKLLESESYIKKLIAFFKTLEGDLRDFNKAKRQRLRQTESEHESIKNKIQARLNRARKTGNMNKVDLDRDTKRFKELEAKIEKEKEEIRRLDAYKPQLPRRDQPKQTAKTKKPASKTRQKTRPSQTAKTKTLSKTWEERVDNARKDIIDKNPQPALQEYTLRF